MTQNDLFCTKDSIGISAAQQLEMGVRKLQLLWLSGLLLLPCGAQINVAQHRRCVTKLIFSFRVGYLRCTRFCSWVITKIWINSNSTKWFVIADENWVQICLFWLTIQRQNLPQKICSGWNISKNKSRPILSIQIMKSLPPQSWWWKVAPLPQPARHWPSPPSSANWMRGY